MAESKKSFVIYLDSLDILDELSTEQKADLFDAIRDYQSGKEVVLKGLMKAVFIPFQNQFKRDLDKYNKIVERNRQNGRKGGRPEKPKKPSGLNGNPVEPKKADNDNDSDNDNDNESDINTSALGFLKLNYPMRLESEFLIKYKSQIQNYKKFEEDFNDTVAIEAIEYNDNKLFARLGKYARNWIMNQSKFSKEPIPGTHESGKQKRV